ncbi:MAG: hypothetical protein U5K54_24185 [Cytophagales bacterium]|nr:hypothetical protein [Cytophagales bacterium]
MLIVLNFSNEVVNLPIQVIPLLRCCLISNYLSGEFLLELRPWEARVYHVTEINS